jgi:streptogrisin C
MAHKSRGSAAAAIALAIAMLSSPAAAEGPGSGAADGKPATVGGAGAPAQGDAPTESRPPLNDEEMLDRDAQAYAEAYSVDLNTGRARLRAQEAIHQDLEQLRTRLGERFVEARIEHQPEHRVLVAVGEGAPADAVPDRIGGVPASRVEAPMPRKALEAFAERVSTRARGRAGGFVGQLDLFNGAVEFEAVDDATVGELRRAEQAERTPSENRVAVRIRNTGQAVEPVARNLRAGYTYNDGTSPVCTAGFNVWRNGVARATTAGHCSNNLNEAGLGLLWEAQTYTGSSDWQVMNAPNHTPLGQYYDGADRRVTGWWGQPTVGDFLCKFGLATGRGCGTVTSTTTQGGGSATAFTFTRMHNANNVDLSNPGDSGGPVFTGGTAAGITHGQIGVDHVSMPLRYLVTGATSGLIFG